MRKAMRRVVVLVALFVIAAAACRGQGLEVVNKGRRTAYLAYKGKPLFAFGPMNEHIVWQVKLGSQLYNVRAWARWQQSNGMNYVRCYPASGYGWTHEIAGHADYLFPFEKASEKPIRFDLERFNPDYWANFRAVAAELKRHDIIVHLQLFQLCYFETAPGGQWRWPFNFWNPRNNVNDFTRTVGPNGRGHHPLIEQIAKGNAALRRHYLRYLDHLLAAVGDLGNVFFDLSNEMGDGGLDLALAKQWIDLTLDHIEEWEKRTGDDILVGQDIACFPDKEYLMRHPRMELIIVHGNHLPGDWTSYGKPVVVVNSNDGGALLYARGEDDRFPRFRKLHWRALMSRVQGVGDYQKEWKVRPGSFPQFDRDARLLRIFFNRLVDYPSLLPAPQCIASAPAARNYCLASGREVVVYMESGPRRAGVKYPEGVLGLKDLPIGTAKARLVIFSPSEGMVSRQEVRIIDGRLRLSLPAFTDDLAVHIVKSG